MELKMALSSKTHYDPASIIQDIINTIKGSPSADVSSVSSMKIGSEDEIFYIHSATYPLVPRYGSYYCHFMQNNCTTHVVIHGVHEVVGEVLRLAKSDGSFTQGGFSSAMVVHQNYIVNIPDKLSPEQEAQLICAAMFLRHTILSSSLRHGGTLRNIEDGGSVGVKSSNADDLSTVETLSAEKVKVFLSTLAGKSYEENGSEIADATEDDVSADQVATLVNYEKSPLQSSSANDESANQSEVHEPFELNTTEVVITNGESGSSESKSKSKTTADKKAKENGSFVTTDSSSHHSGRKGHDYSSKKGVKAGRTVGENELSKFSDTSGDALLDDLFQPNDKLDDRSAEASTSASSSHVNQGNTFVTDSGKIDFATKLRATIAKKQMENDPGQSNGGDILHLMIGVLKEDVIGIDGLGFDDKLPRTILATFRSSLPSKRSHTILENNTMNLLPALESLQKAIIKKCRNIEGHIASASTFVNVVAADEDSDVDLFSEETEQETTLRVRKETNRSSYVTETKRYVHIMTGKFDCQYEARKCLIYDIVFRYSNFNLANLEPP
ncbi:MAP3K epsilon protein kinase 1-like protein isoform X1 [Tanacetum coccineum]